MNCPDIEKRKSLSLSDLLLIFLLSASTNAFFDGNGSSVLLVKTRGGVAGAEGDSTTADGLEIASIEEQLLICCVLDGVSMVE